MEPPNEPSDPPHAEEAPRLAPLLAEQVALIRAQLEPAAAADEILRYVDAAALNLCEYVEVEFGFLDRVLALRAAAERLSQARESPQDGGEGEALARARAELAALEAALITARPSEMTRALGQGW